MAKNGPPEKRSMGSYHSGEKVDYTTAAKPISKTGKVPLLRNEPHRSSDMGERSHKHAFPGDTVHDQHLKAKNNLSMTHLAGAVKELNDQHPNYHIVDKGPKLKTGM